VFRRNAIRGGGTAACVHAERHWTARRPGGRRSSVIRPTSRVTITASTPVPPSRQMFEALMRSPQWSPVTPLADAYEVSAPCRVAGFQGATKVASSPGTYGAAKGRAARVLPPRM
jgi:hypothetical protein